MSVFQQPKYQVRFLLFFGLSVLLALLAPSSAQSEMLLYHTNRHFTVDTFNYGDLPADLFTAITTQRTAIVRGTNVIIDTNGVSVVESEGIALGYPSANSAWTAATGAMGIVKTYTNQTRDHVGWVRGTRSAYGEWCAYLWKAENHLAFKSSATNVWQVTNGVWAIVSNVLVGSLGNYLPMSNVVDVGPTLPTNSPGADQWDEGDYGVDITNVYYLLKVPFYNSLSDLIKAQEDIAATKDPINTMSGNLSIDESDLLVPCPGISLEFGRSYNSVQTNTGTFGKGWTHTYEWRLTPVQDLNLAPSTWMTLRTPQGSEFKFPKRGNTYGPCPENNLELITTGAVWQVRVPAGLIYEFNTNGVLTKITDSWSNQLALTYSTNGLLTRVEHGNGQGLDFSYDTNSRLTGVTADATLAMTFGYDSSARLTSATRTVSGKTYTTTYSYGTDAAVVQRVNARGDVSAYGYTTNAVGKYIKGSSVDVGGYYTHTVRYTSNDQTVVTYTNGNNTQSLTYTYDPETLRLYEVHGPGAKVTTYDYDYNNDNITNETVTDTNVNETIYQTRLCDTNHNVLQSGVGYNAPATKFWTTQWHATNQLPTLITDPDSSKFGFEYQNGAIARSKAYYSANNSYDTVYAHNQNGQISQITTPNNATVSYTYDTYGNLASVTPSAGPALTYSFDRLGCLQQVSMPGNRTVQYASDAQGWVTGVTYPDSSSEAFGYDALGNVTNHVDRAGRVTRMSWLPTRKPSSVKRVLSGGQQVGIDYEYDRQFNTVNIRDALGRAVESYALDSQDRPISITNIDNQTMTVTYGVGSMVKSVTRFDGSTVNNTFNGDGLLSQIAYPNATVTLGYQANGLVQSVGDSAGTVSNSYNMLGQVIRTEGITPNDEVSYGYYPGGQVAAVTSVAGIVRYTLDAGDRLSAITSPVGSFAYGYNTNNGLVSGVSCASGVSVGYGFDLLDRATNIVWQNATNGVVRSLRYQYSSAGMITNMVRENGESAVFGYDELDRLTSEEWRNATNGVVHTAQYQYDLVGNRTQATVNGVSENYALTGGNRLTSWGFGGHANFDTAGNVTSLEFSNRTVGLTWDSRYRLTSASVTGTWAESYGYDALGRRVSISDSVETNYLVYDGVHVVADVTAAGSLKRRYVYGAGIDNILAMTVYGASTDTYFYVKDHLGSVQALVSTNGAVVESYRYDAWGNVLGVYDSTGGVLQASAVGNRYLWQGREYSFKTGLYYFRARWYEPVTGRWLSNDPIGISGGLDQYVFCSDNPVMGRDVFGLDDGNSLNILDELTNELLQPFDNFAQNTIGRLSYEIRHLILGDESSREPELKQGTAGHTFNELCMLVGMVRGGGRLGGPLHRTTVAQRGAALQQQGHTITSGGGQMPERGIRTPEGRLRFPDIGSQSPSGKPYYENVGRSTKSGSPISRERSALDDIRRATGTEPGYTPYDR